MRYVARKLITHGKTGKLIHPGEPVDLSHLKPEEIKVLIEAGVVAEDKKENKREVKDG